MDADDLKQAWRSQASPKLTLSADLVLKQVERNRESFAATVFWRDVREVGVGLVMVPVWIYLGAKHDLPWMWYLTIPALLWIAGFMLVDRLRHKRTPPSASEPLSRHVRDSLAQVEHQTWLLRNVLWWYLLPPGITIMAFFFQAAWLAREGGWTVLLGIAGAIGFAMLVFASVYWLNRTAVRSELEPRCAELRALFNASDEAIGALIKLHDSQGVAF